MNIIGLSAFYHDSSAVLLQNGVIKAAVQEERFTRIKHDQQFPSNALQYCLSSNNLSLSDIDYFVFYEKPFLKFERLLETYLSFAPKGFKSFLQAMPLWIKEKLFQKKQICESVSDNCSGTEVENRLLFAEHHQSHAASAFYPSPFQESLVLTMDGVGEWTTTSVAIGKGNQLDFVKELHFPHSLGLLYSAFTYYLGFKVNSGEYKIMGLAPYGSPKYVDVILENLIDIKPDGSFRLNMQYFDYCTNLKMTNEAFNRLFGREPRKAESEITQMDMDLAASIQEVTEKIILQLTSSLAKEYEIPNLCLAGGVALNCVANGKLLKNNSFKNIWVQPAAGDAGGALGAALSAHYSYLKNTREVSTKSIDAMQGSYLGPKFSQKDVETSLHELGGIFEVFPESEMNSKVATLLSEGNVVGWVQGRMEFGPRALGNRSILGDPRSDKMQKVLNLKIKYRESFRPFAPSVLYEDVSEWFDFEEKSPYMLMVSDINANKKCQKNLSNDGLTGLDKLQVRRSEIPAVTHVDYSARIQTVHKETNPRYYSLLESFKSLTGCPVLINTSFNIRNEPIVCTPRDAFRCFMGTDMDALVIGDCLLIKSLQDKNLKISYKNNFELD